jgi:predicted ATPase
MAPGTAPSPQHAFERVLRFGPFTLDPARKLLTEDDRAVRLGGRALDLLIALVESAGEVVSHETLFARVWPRTVVEESSLRVHVSTLRKALGDSGEGPRYIASLPGRGYSFMMEVRESRPSLPEPREDPPAAALPTRMTAIVGRADALAVLSAKLQQHRLVTIVGPGGIGKTTVALALAEQLARRHAHGAVFVDLAPLGDPSLVPAAFGAALGIPVPAQSPWPTLEAALESRDLLIVLDNCEHVIAGAAVLAERVLRAAPLTRVLATSHEPLEAESEAVHRLAALELPPDSHPLDPDAALAYPAVRLFVERAAASTDDFALTPANLASVVRVCRHLDGLPLAIELAAARVGSLGVHAVADRLDDVFRLLRGRRTGLPRHRTLQALLDWSEELLEADERTVLRRLSMFRSSFTLESAAELASCERVGPHRVVACLLGLVSRSLVEIEHGEKPRYRLLFVTRLHAAGRLAEDGDARELGRRHAACFRDLLARANAGLASDRMSLSAWLATCAPALSDMRAALAWASGPAGDKPLGVELVIEMGRLAIELGLHDEVLPHCLDAYESLKAFAVRDGQMELRLLSLMCTAASGCIADRDLPLEVPARLEELTLRVGTPVQARTTLMALCMLAFRQGEYPELLLLAERFATLPPDDTSHSTLDGVLMHRRFRALGRHYLGRHDEALPEFAWVLEQAGPSPAGSPHFHQIPLRVSIGIQRARILWLQGHPDSALACAREAVAVAGEALMPTHSANAFGYSQAMALALIPILLWRGEDAEATVVVDRLVDNALRSLQSFWLTWSASYCRVLALRGQDVERLGRRLGAGWGRSPTTMEADMLGTLASELAGPEQLARVEAGTVGWCAPEMLRAHAEGMVSVPSRRAQSEELLLRSLKLARRQGARSWELRTATTLATLWGSTSRREAARTLLAEVMAGFAEGFECVDMRRAQALLAAWSELS